MRIIGISSYRQHDRKFGTIVNYVMKHFFLLLWSDFITRIYTAVNSIRSITSAITPSLSLRTFDPGSDIAAASTYFLTTLTQTCPRFLRTPALKFLIVNPIKCKRRALIAKRQTQIERTLHRSLAVIVCSPTHDLFSLFVLCALCLLWTRELGFGGVCLSIPSSTR